MPPFMRCNKLSFTPSKISDFIDHIFPCELEMKDTTESNTFASYLDLCTDNGKLVTRLYNRRDDFNFPIVNLTFLSSNVPSAPANTELSLN